MSVEKPTEPESQPKKSPAKSKLPAILRTEVTCYDSIQGPGVIRFAEEMGKAIFKSHMFGCTNVDQGRVLALECLSQKCTPLTLTRRYHIIGGNLSMKADAMLAEFRQRGGDHKVIERTPNRACIELKLGRSKAQRFSFTLEEANQEDYTKKKGGKIWKDNWKTPRRRMQMLWARLVSDSIRVVCPEVVAGSYTPEELSPDAFAEPQEDADVIDGEFTVQAIDEADRENDAMPPDDEVPGPEIEPEEEKSPEPELEPEPEIKTPEVDRIDRVPPEKTTLKAMAWLKKSLGLGAEKWEKVLGKRETATGTKVKTAHELTERQAQELNMNLANFLRQRELNADQKEWLDKVLGESPS